MGQLRRRQKAQLATSPSSYMQPYGVDGGSNCQKFLSPIEFSIYVHSVVGRFAVLHRRSIYGKLVLGTRPKLNLTTLGGIVIYVFSDHRMRMKCASFHCMPKIAIPFSGRCPAPRAMCILAIEIHTMKQSFRKSINETAVLK